MKLTLTIFLFFCVFVVDAQIITLVAGAGSGPPGDGGPATAAVLRPCGAAFDKYGNLYVTDENKNSIRKIAPSGTISTFAGGGTGGYGGDGGPASAAWLYKPESVILDKSGNVFICDVQNNAIRKVDITTGVISTVAGTGTSGFYGDGGPATNAQLKVPVDICFDNFGNLIIADLMNYRIRKVDGSGIITTIAGTGSVGTPGEHVPATASAFSYPMGVATDRYGNIFVADPGVLSSKVHKIDAGGILTSFAGNGSSSYIGDGVPATTAAINPFRMAFNSAGEMFISDRYNHRVYRIDAVGLLHNIGGNGIAGDSGDGGIATLASLSWPLGISLDMCDNIYICNTGPASPTPGNRGRRVRKIDMGMKITPTISISSGTSYASGSTVKLTAAVTDTCASYLIHWLNKGVVFATTTTPSVSYTKGAGIDTITARVVPQCGSCYDSTTSLQHIVFNTALGIGGVGVQPVRVYPNPAQGELTITAGTQITGVTISNIIGRQVYSHECNTENVTMNIAHLPAGVYTVKITGDGWLEVRKVVKE